MALRQGLSLVAIGLLIGLPLAAGASRVLSVFLYGLPPFHIPTFIGAAMLFGIVGLAASYLAVRRVVGIDPSHTLRSA
jgi:putative ABC transport system permease protein